MEDNKEHQEIKPEKREPEDAATQAVEVPEPPPGPQQLVEEGQEAS